MPHIPNPVTHPHSLTDPSSRSWMLRDPFLWDSFSGMFMEHFDSFSAGLFQDFLAFLPGWLESHFWSKFSRIPQDRLDHLWNSQGFFLGMFLEHLQDFLGFLLGGWSHFWSKFFQDPAGSFWACWIIFGTHRDSFFGSFSAGLFQDFFRDGWSHFGSKFARIPQNPAGSFESSLERSGILLGSFFEQDFQCLLFAILFAGSLMDP